jgi:acyl carrier protein
MDINDKLTEVFKEVFDLSAEQIKPELKKDDVVKWDSLAQMELVVSIEKKFNIELKLQEIVNMDSIEAIIEILNSKEIKI